MTVCVCWKCGRWGTRQFIESNRSDAVGRWECANDAACAQRVAAIFGDPKSPEVRRETMSAPYSAISSLL